MTQTEQTRDAVEAGYWSFDDYAIGRLNKEAGCLASREISRPSGLTRRDWYSYAQAVCAALSTLPRTDSGQEGEPFQDRVSAWMLECFTPEIAADMLERADRFTEEALELAQTVPDFTVARAHALVDYVFSRPIGERSQEVGGVMVTLAALCGPAGIDMVQAAETEYSRISDPLVIEKIRAKQASKPTGSALPTAQPSASAGELADELEGQPVYELVKNVDTGELDPLRNHVRVTVNLRDRILTTLRQQPPADVEAVLREAARNLLNACYHADAVEELTPLIDGALLDELGDALEETMPIVFTDEQVKRLSAYQARKDVHVLTCGGDRGSEAHRAHAEEHGEDMGQLYPTPRGLLCPVCDYRQTHYPARIDTILPQEADNGKG